MSDFVDRTIGSRGGAALSATDVLGLPQWTVFTIVLAAALSVGAALAVHVSMGIALVAIAAYASLIVLNLRTAIALWVPMLFLEGIEVFDLGGKAAGVLLLLGWLIALPQLAAQKVWREQAWLVVILTLFEVWLSLSLIWAAHAGTTLHTLWQWYAVALVFVVVTSVMTDGPAVRAVVNAFVIGAVLSVVIGVVRHDFPAAAGGRFTGTIGDPNFLAAALVPAIILALGLLAGRRQTLWRLTIFVAVGILAAGFAATGSRGGLVAALVVLPAAIVLCKRQRPYLIGLAVASLFAVAVVHSLFPGPWERSASLGPGSGRGDLWTVAWHVARDHPITGVGLDNFSVVAGGYTRTVGPLRSVDLIAVHPHEVHNVYLQLLAELGIVGLVLFVVFVVGCLRAGWLAVKRFEAVGDGPGAVLANTIVLAAFSMLVSAVFISDAVDRRLWVLLALALSILTASGVPQPSS